MAQSVKGYIRNSEGKLVKGTFNGRLGKEVKYDIVAYCNPVSNPEKADAFQKCSGKVLLYQSILLDPQRAKKLHKNKRKFDILTKVMKMNGGNISIKQCYPSGKFSTPTDKNQPKYVKSTNSLLTYNHTRCNVKFGNIFYSPASLEIRFRKTEK